MDDEEKIHDAKNLKGERNVRWPVHESFAVRSTYKVDINENEKECARMAHFGMLF